MASRDGEDGDGREQRRDAARGRGGRGRERGRGRGRERGARRGRSRSRSSESGSSSSSSSSGSSSSGAESRRRGRPRRRRSPSPASSRSRSRSPSRRRWRERRKRSRSRSKSYGRRSRRSSPSRSRSRRYRSRSPPRDRDGARRRRRGPSRSRSRNRSRSLARDSKRRRRDQEPGGGGSERGGSAKPSKGGRAAAQPESDPLFSFSAWARQQETNRLPVSEAGYQAYVQGWQAKQASDYFDKHGTEEWFLNRYDVTRVAALQDSLCERAVTEAARLVADAATDAAVLDKLCPALDAVPESRRKPKVSKAVGDPLAESFVAFVPRVPPAVTSTALAAAVREALASAGGEADGDKSASFTLLVGEPLLVEKQGGGSRKSSGRNLFNRDAWVAFDAKESADALQKLGKIQAKATPVTPGAEPESVDLTVLERRLLGNRFAFKEVSSPARIRIDLAQARKVAVMFDQARGVEQGIDALLKNEGALKLVTDAPSHIAAVAANDAKDAGAAVASDEEKKDQDAAAATTEEDLPGDEAQRQALVRQRRELDLIIGYLRHVHLTCYYGHRMYVSAGEMAQLNMLPYLRHFPSKEMCENGWKDVEDARAKAAAGEKDEKEEAADPEAALVAALKEILEPRKSTYLRNVDEAVASWVEKFSPEKVQAEREARAAKLERAKALMAKAEEDFCKSQTRFEEKGKYRCLLPPFKRFASEEFVHKHIRTKQADQVEAARVKAVRELVRQEFLDADDKPLAPLPDYAKPKDRSYYQANFGAGPDGAGNMAQAAAQAQSGAPSLPAAQAQPRKFRTVIDYSDI